jgi:hypothetical protein
MGSRIRVGWNLEAWNRSAANVARHFRFTCDSSGTTATAPGASRTWLPHDAAQLQPDPTAPALNIIGAAVVSS